MLAVAIYVNVISGDYKMLSVLFFLYSVNLDLDNQDYSVLQTIFVLKNIFQNEVGPKFLLTFSHVYRKL